MTKGQSTLDVQSTAVVMISMTVMAVMMTATTTIGYAPDALEKQVARAR